MAAVVKTSMWAAVVCIVVSVAISVDGDATRSVKQVRQRSVEASPFGVFYGVPSRKGRPTTKYLEELGVEWTRQTLDWEAVEPRRGIFRWDLVDGAVELVEASERAGRPVRMLVTMRARASWAARGDRSARRREATIPPKDLQDYYRFVNATVKRARGKIRYWQIENEVYTPTFWVGSAEEYLQLLRTGYRAVKDADPSAQVVLAGIGAWHVPMLEDFLAAGRGEEALELYRLWARDNDQAPTQVPSTPSELARMGASSERGNREGSFVRVLLDKKNAPFFDVVDLHVYHPYRAVPHVIQWAQQAMSREGYSKPIWITETSGPAYPRLWPSVATGERRQAEEVVKRYVLAISAGAERVFWYALMAPQHQEKGRSSHVGLLRPNLSKRPAFGALALMSRMLEGAREVRVLEVGGVQVFQFVLPRGSVWVLWADEGATLRIQAEAGRVEVIDGLGNRSTREARNGSLELSLSSMPLFVTGEIAMSGRAEKPGGRTGCGMTGRRAFLPEGGQRSPGVSTRVEYGSHGGSNVASSKRTVRCGGYALLCSERRCYQ